MCWLCSFPGRVNRELLRELMRLFKLTAADSFVLELVPLSLLLPKDLPERLLMPKLPRMDMEALKVVLGL